MTVPTLGRDGFDGRVIGVDGAVLAVVIDGDEVAPPCGAVRVVGAMAEPPTELVENPPVGVLPPLKVTGAEYIGLGLTEELTPPPKIVPVGVLLGFRITTCPFGSACPFPWGVEILGTREA